MGTFLVMNTRFAPHIGQDAQYKTYSGIGYAKGEAAFLPLSLKNPESNCEKESGRDAASTLAL